MKKDKQWICYCLQSKKRYTYVGITNNFKRRHRQHNGKIVGGAKYTRRYRPWNTLFKIYGLTSHKHVLQLEWAIKHRRKSGYSGIKGRLRTLEHLFKMDQWTKKAPLIKTLNLTVKCRMTRAEYLKYSGFKEIPRKTNIKYIFLKKNNKTKKK